MGTIQLETDCVPLPLRVQRGPAGGDLARGRLPVAMARGSIPVPPDLPVPAYGNSAVPCGGSGGAGSCRDRKSVDVGKSVSVRVDHGGSRNIQKKQQTRTRVIEV